MAEHRSSIEIEADPEAVFEFLVTEAGMTAWMGEHARLDPTPGGVFAVDIAGYPVRGEYLEVDRPRRITVSWGFAGNSDLPPESSTVTFTLTAVPAGTRVDLLHAGLPAPQLAGHADGWAHFLPRLSTRATGADPGPDTWVPAPDRTT